MPRSTPCAWLQRRPPPPPLEGTLSLRALAALPPPRLGLWGLAPLRALHLPALLC